MVVPHISGGGTARAQKPRLCSTVVPSVLMVVPPRRQRGGGAASHDQPPYRAGHPRPGRGQGHFAREANVACRGNNSQGRSVPLAGATARKVGWCHLRGQQLAGAALVGMTGCDQPIGAKDARGHTRLQCGTCKGATARDQPCRQ
ncbi:hypothetical protein BHE74_00032631 [Ensete ventricosum]|nr:hypothetical protein BHE74_00032631 [Ensete ventricosum]